MAIERKRVSVTEVISLLKRGYTRYTADDAGFGSVQQHYSLTTGETKILFRHEALKRIKTKFPILEIIDDRPSQQPRGAAQDTQPPSSPGAPEATPETRVETVVQQPAITADERPQDVPAEPTPVGPVNNTEDPGTEPGYELPGDSAAALTETEISELISRARAELRKIGTIDTVQPAPEVEVEKERAEELTKQVGAPSGPSLLERLRTGNNVDKKVENNSVVEDESDIFD
jgi:hypothetical protein